MPEVLEIIKRRWPEVVLVVGFQICVFFLKTMLMEMAEESLQAAEADKIIHSPFWVSFLLGMGTMVFAIVAYMFLFGFIATACHEGIEKKEPIDLLRAGRYFFWRMIRFEIVFSIFLFAIVTVLSFIFGGLFLGIKPGEEIPYGLSIFCMLAALVILVKPMVLSPAVMIARDKMVIESIKLLKEYRLMEAKNLLLLVGASFIVTAGFSGSLTLVESGTSYYYAVVGVCGFLSSVLLLLVNLSAVRFVASSTRIPEEDSTDEKV